MKQKIFMLKNQICFILICLSFNLYSDTSSNIGIENSYINDKINVKKINHEKIKNINIYDVKIFYNLSLNNFYFKTTFDVGKGSSHQAFRNNFKTHAKEKILDYNFYFSYFFQMGPLYFGPELGFDYNLQKLKTFNKFSLEWYLPTLGFTLKLTPLASYSWFLYTTYDFSYGRVKFCSLFPLRENAIRNKFFLGSCSQIYGSLFADIYFSYSQAKNHTLSRESFEGCLALSYEF